ncbi:hypothetical protein BBR47_54290 [Brevibacillus brevis NBRC 100599]|uniref:Uncharacterized protein n=1 Tax=Brevibacillus brevis (strain 47 / JCM 6285 / NBRC 100599) TaxID=358681 RepID=C0Z757_BREBN|nr:hypothetical protein BBR47_54290 [Brevibacillus brevis NBRC 100599]
MNVEKHLQTTTIAGVFLHVVQTVEKRCGRAGLSGLET